jgi:hypothetical protein
VKLWFALFAAACGAPDGETPTIDKQAEPVVCEVVVSSSPELEAAVVSGAEQWSAAVDCSLRVAAGGVPVSLVDRVLNSKGEPQCGVTRRLRDSAGAVIGVSAIEISASRADRCWQTERHVLHELGHVLAPRCGHTTQGLLAAVPDGTDYVDASSAAFVNGCLH